MTLLYFKYRQPATVTVTGSIDVPVGLLAPGREKELKDYIVRDGAHTYQNAKSDIDYEEYPDEVQITLTEERVLK